MRRNSTTAATIPRVIPRVALSLSSGTGASGLSALLLALGLSLVARNKDGLESWCWVEAGFVWMGTRNGIIQAQRSLGS